MTTPRTGPAPYGYMRQDGHLIRDPDEAAIRLRAFELFAEHGRVTTVANILNEEKHTTRSDTLFNATSIKRWLSDPIVIGKEDGVEQIVPEELWERCNAILSAQESTGGPPRKVINLFSGFIYCGCGQKMYVPTNSKKYVCRDCKNKVAGDDLEEIFHAQLENYPLPADLKSDGPSLHEKWVGFSFENKRKLIEAIADRIEISDAKKVTCFLVIL